MPAGTVRIIVPYKPGGITDILARALAQMMTAPPGHSVVVENRAGANGSIGAAVVARGVPDGFLLLLGVTDTHAVNPASIIAQLNQAVAKAMPSPGMLDVLRSQAALPDATTPEGLATLVRQEQEAWGRVVRAGNIRLD